MAPHWCICQVPNHGRAGRTTDFDLASCETNDSARPAECLTTWRMHHQRVHPPSRLTRQFLL